ncbi:hypothetical protein [Hydrogenophaga sp. ANAO-22]|uniref:hypothetical protein n=1 Tax=Hydrogenophaga sp. ANAO-22 TaxID=3166645 RepID=UPI0036D3C326
MEHHRISHQDALQAAKCQAVTVVELSERESAEALHREFGITDFADTEPAELALVEIDSDHLRRQVSRAAGHSRYDDLAMCRVPA